MNTKSVISVAACALLSVWYLAAIVGFDVHTDHHEDEVYVVSLLGRTDCESLHPEDVCHCLEHQCGHCHADDEDCENEISILSLTGDGFELVCDFQFCGLAIRTIDTVCDNSFVRCDHVESISCVPPPRESLSRFCVLRV